MHARQHTRTPPHTDASTHGSKDTEELRLKGSSSGGELIIRAAVIRGLEVHVGFDDDVGSLDDYTRVLATRLR